jgi:hypothetical protein
MGNRGAVLGAVLQWALPALILAVCLSWLVVGWDSEHRAATSAAVRAPLQAAPPRPAPRLDPDAAVVAIINGTAITRGWLNAVTAAAPLRSLSDPAAAENGSQRSLLEAMVDDEILAQAAAASGIALTDDDVTRAIQARFLAPLHGAAGDRSAALALLAVLGEDGDTLVGDVALRHAVGNALLIEQYLIRTASDRATLLAAARPRAAVNIFLREQVSYR